MRLEDVQELYGWMLTNRILHCSAEGVTLTLDPSALPPVVLPPLPEGAAVPDDDEEQETPQARIRREFAAGKMDGEDDDA